MTANASARPSVTPSVIPSVTLGFSEEGRAGSLLPSGLPDFDASFGGFPRGRVSEILGPASVGKTSLLLRALAASAGRGELGALVDLSGTLFPSEPWASGRLLVLRPAHVEDGLRAFDALLSSAVFGLIALETSSIGKLLPEAIVVRAARLARETGSTVIACGLHGIFGSSCALRLELSKDRMGDLRIAVTKNRQGPAGEITITRRGDVEKARMMPTPRRVA